MPAFFCLWPQFMKSFCFRSQVCCCDRFSCSWWISFLLCLLRHTPGSRFCWVFAAEEFPANPRHRQGCWRLRCWEPCRRCRCSGAGHLPDCLPDKQTRSSLLMFGGFFVSANLSKFTWPLPCLRSFCHRPPVKELGGRPRFFWLFWNQSGLKQDKKPPFVKTPQQGILAIPHPREGLTLEGVSQQLFASLQTFPFFSTSQGSVKKSPVASCWIFFLTSAMHVLSAGCLSVFNPSFSQAPVTYPTETVSPWHFPHFFAEKRWKKRTKIWWMDPTETPLDPKAAQFFFHQFRVVKNTSEFPNHPGLHVTVLPCLFSSEPVLKQFLPSTEMTPVLFAGSA